MSQRIRFGLWALILVVVLNLFSISSFAEEIDVTDRIELETTRIFYDRRTGIRTHDIAMTNNSQETVFAPHRVIITSISSSAVTVANADGTTTEGFPFFTYETNIMSGATSASRSWEFNNPTRVRYTYTVQVLAQSPEAPTVSLSAIPLQIIAGQSATLTWTSMWADACNIEPGIGSIPVNGSYEVSPEETTTYIITATGPVGSISDEITINFLVADNDGLPDAWELQYFGSLDALRDGDYDGDGVSNYIEYKINTDPTEATSRPDMGMYFEYDDSGRMVAVFVVKASGEGYEVRYCYDGLSRRTGKQIHIVQQ